MPDIYIKLITPSKIDKIHFFGNSAVCGAYMQGNKENKMKNSTTKRITAFVICALAFTASACHTVEGVGKDLESVGDKAEEVTKN